MPIPEEQLETWSHQGSIQGSSNTYKTIKDTLEAPGTPYSEKGYEVFLQGSYGNDTNIFSESDVDIVIKLNDCFLSDLENLSDAEKTAWTQSHNDAEYTHRDFKKDVLQVLKDKFDGSVTVGDKAIAIAANGNRRKADVITAIQYRRYYKFNSFADQSFTSGICFHNGNADLIANYPRLHLENLTKAHQASASWLKPMVRIMKNLRGKLVADGLLEAGIAPSYFIEGLMYNVPSDKFGINYGDSWVNSVNWLQQEADKEKLVCANEQYYLLRDGHLVTWNQKNYDLFMSAAIKLWNDWD